MSELVCINERTLINYLSRASNLASLKYWFVNLDFALENWLKGKLLKLVDQFGYSEASYYCHFVH